MNDPKFVFGEKVFIAKVNKVKTVVFAYDYGGEWAYRLVDEDGSEDDGWREDELTPHRDVQQMLYRYFTGWINTPSDASEFGILDSEGDEKSGFPCLHIFQVIRETDKSWYIRYGGREKRVLKGNGKRFAHETKEWAYKSFRKRCRARISILERDLTKVKDALSWSPLSLPMGEAPGVYIEDGKRYFE